METQYCSNCKHADGYRSRPELLKCNKTRWIETTGEVKMRFCQHIRDADACTLYEEKRGYTTTIVVFVSFAAFGVALYLAI